MKVDLVKDAWKLDGQKSYLLLHQLFSHNNNDLYQANVLWAHQ